MNPKQGGPAQGIRNSIPEMCKFGVENNVVCLDNSDADYLGSDSFKIYALGNSGNVWSYSRDLIPWLIENFSKYDVVIIHGLWQYPSFAAVRAIDKFKKNHGIGPKIYLMPHGMLDPYFQKAKGRKFKAIRNWLYWKLIENNVVSKVDGILFTCEGELQLAKKAFKPYFPKKELNVGYGIATPPLYNETMMGDLVEKLPLWNGKPFMLFLGRVHEKKGVELVINSYLKLEASSINMPQLIIAGPGLESDYGKRMIDIAKGCKDILFPGMLSGNAKWGAFYKSECFVLPSHQENFGISIVESMACGKGVLITDKVNIWHEILNGKAGLVSNDTESDVFLMLKKWVHFSDNEKLEIGRNAYNTYKRFFSIEKAARKMIESL